jgi:glycosyltransferase involved in cell wall biosynthesis
MSNDRAKVAVLINMIAPARVPLYSGLAANFELLLLHGGIESNRDCWKDAERELQNAKVTQAWGWQIKIIKKEKGKFFDLQHVHFTPGYIWHLIRFGPDAVITNEMGFRTLVALSYGALFRKPVWVWWGGTLHTERRVGPARRALRWVISRWAQNWISYGESSTEYLLSCGIGRDRIFQTQNAADERRFATDAEPQFKLAPRPIVLHVGQFIARKGIELFLDAASCLQKEGQDFSLLFVGSGRDRQSLEQLAQRLGVKNVHFQSSQSPKNMPSVYRSADVLIFPTLEDVWGLVANEAILSGLPVLCSKYAGCAQELFHPENIFDPENKDEFIRKLRQAISGQLRQPDLSRLKTTPQIVGEMVRALESSLRQPPSTSRDAAIEQPNQ